MGAAKRLAAHIAAGGEDWGLHGVRSGSRWWRWRGHFRVLTPAGQAVLSAFASLKATHLSKRRRPAG